jgi:hypothetical protein
MALRFGPISRKQDFSQKRRLQIDDLQSRNFYPFPVPKRVDESSLEKYDQLSLELDSERIFNLLFKEKNNLAISLGQKSNCIVFRVRNGGDLAFKRLRTGRCVCSDDTYAVETIHFVDYYYKITHVPFVIPTGLNFCGNAIDLLAANSFVLAAGSFDQCDDDGKNGREYDVVNDKDVLLLPQILEEVIAQKFCLLAPVN